jgi:hypothetical protein
MAQRPKLSQQGHTEGSLQTQKTVLGLTSGENGFSVTNCSRRTFEGK